MRREARRASTTIAAAVAASTATPMTAGCRQAGRGGARRHGDGRWRRRGRSGECAGRASLATGAGAPAVRTAAGAV